MDYSPICWNGSRAGTLGPSASTSIATGLSRPTTRPAPSGLRRLSLRSGNVHSADGWRAVLEPVVARYRDAVKRLYFRGDAAFANPEIYEFLEAEGMSYAIR